ncbi:MAG: helix-turn-helix domain-containing protein [Gammaproteobacteria bacterium]|nr:helix-turn-helix domain-containing protein [Gammaproteobacteria bacterium]
MSNKLLLRQRIYDYFDAWNQADAKLVASFFSDDAVYVDTALNKEYLGSEIEQYISEILSFSTRKIHFTILEEPVINGDVVFLQSSLKIHTGKESQQLESAELIKFKEQQIVMIQTYYNLDEQLEPHLFEKDKYAKSGLDQAQINSIKNKLEKVMEVEEPYKDSSLKLQDLAEMLDIRRNHLSQILNHEYQMKFFDFLNHYRLQTFLKLLHQRADSEVNITELAYDSGFSSSSVFYKIFKRYQDISPRQYLKNITTQTQ